MSPLNKEATAIYDPVVVAVSKNLGRQHSTRNMSTNVPECNLSSMAAAPTAGIR